MKGAHPGRTSAATNTKTVERLHLLNSCVVSFTNTSTLTLPPKRGGAAALLCHSVRCWATDVFPGNDFAVASASREVAKPTLCTQTEPACVFQL